jgi:hypothetical protein
MVMASFRAGAVGFERCANSARLGIPHRPHLDGGALRRHISHNECNACAVSSVVYKRFFEFGFDLHDGICVHWV